MVQKLMYFASLWFSRSSRSLNANTVATTSTRMGKKYAMKCSADQFESHSRSCLASVSRMRRTTGALMRHQMPTRMSCTRRKATSIAGAQCCAAGFGKWDANSRRLRSHALVLANSAAATRRMVKSREMFRKRHAASVRYNVTWNMENANASTHDNTNRPRRNSPESCTRGVPRTRTNKRKRRASRRDPNN